MSCPSCKNNIESLIPTADKHVDTTTGRVDRIYVCRVCKAKWRCITYTRWVKDKHTTDTLENIRWEEVTQ